MSRPSNWEDHWPSDDELLGRAVIAATRRAKRENKWVCVMNVFIVESTLAHALVERYVAEDGSLKP